MVTFVFSNPGHHVDMMVPVARELVRRNIGVRFISLAELRGLRTPSFSAVPGAEVVRVIPAQIRTSASAGAGVGTNGGVGQLVRRLARRIAWTAALGPRLRWLMRGSDVVVVPNDAAYPYDHLVKQLHVPFVLLQEGIRFPLPVERDVVAYGGAGAASVCAWGEASAEHFRHVGASIDITGNPRFDHVEPAAWAERGAELRARLGLDRAPLLYLSNTIDDQGFCSTAEKMSLFERFLRDIAPVVDRAVAVKLHPREDVAAFRAVAARVTGVDARIVEGEPLFSVLAMGHAAVVLASTVGLEALAFGLPLGVLEIPGHGHVFEYVDRGVAVPLRQDALASGVRELLASRPDPAITTRFLDRHMAHRGHAAERIAARIIELQGLS